MTLLEQLESCVASTPLAEALPRNAEPFLERRGRDAALESLSDSALRGLARVIGSSAESARYLSIRPRLLERLVAAGPESLERRARELERLEAPGNPGDLESYLDELRLVRRDGTVFAACLQLGGQAGFEQVSEFLSILAEACVRWALLAARASAELPLVIVGMGKIAGREFSYASDLDLIFLTSDKELEIAGVSSLAQRLISYLTSMTPAGVAYAVDARLRPSGGQGTLVSTFESFERYQLERAHTWEHLALVRARAIAGDTAAGQAVLERVRDALLGRGHSPWAEIAKMRARVERERGREEPGCVALKTGRGGLMDVEFLASGSLLERGTPLPRGHLPGVPALLRSAASGAGADAVLEAYAFLRLVEGCARFTAGRALESVRLEGRSAGVLAEIVEPGCSPQELAARVERARESIRRGYEAVIRADGITGLAS